MSPELTSAIAKLREKGEALGNARTLEQSLEDDRAAVKADAIQRVMKREGIAATRAEAIVETDEEYFLHREKQRASIVARYKADAEYWAAKAEVTQVSLITPDVMLLEADNRALLQDRGDLLEANRALLRGKNEAIAAASDLEERLDEANRSYAELSDRVASLNETIAVYQSRGSEVTA